MIKGAFVGRWSLGSLLTRILDPLSIQRSPFSLFSSRFLVQGCDTVYALPTAGMARSNRPPSTDIDEGIWAFDFGGSCFGIPIRVHYTLFLFAFIEVFAAGLSYKEEKFTLLIFILYGPVLTLTVLLVSDLRISGLSCFDMNPMAHHF
jgi:hypothetical protein